MLIKENLIGNTKIEIYDDFIPNEKKKLKNNITNIYDLMNNYSSKLKKNEKNIIFYKDIKNVEII